MSEFTRAYEELEGKLRQFGQRKDEPGFFLPNLPPKKKAQFVLIGMEPSDSWMRPYTDGWEQRAQQKIDEGLRNFYFWTYPDFPSTPGLSALLFSIRRYLSPAGNVYVTDMSKNAMSLAKANGRGRARYDRYDRYDRWFCLLEKELELVGPGAKNIAISQKVGGYFRKWKPDFPLTMTICHYAGNARGSWETEIKDHKEGYQEFSRKFDVGEVKIELRDAMKEYGLSGQRLDHEMNKVKTDAGLPKLIFGYKLAFEKVAGIRPQGGRLPP